jgi:hypothetical protein
LSGAVRSTIFRVLLDDSGHFQYRAHNER